MLYLQAKKEADVTLSDEVNRNWAEIASREYLFDRHEKTIALLEACEKEKMVKHITSIINTKQERKKFSVQVIGNPDGIKMQTEVDEDEDGVEEGEECPAPSDLDPDSVFEMVYLNCDDKALSPSFILDSKSFKKGLKTYDVTHITK